MKIPRSTSDSPMSRRTTHCVHKVTDPSDRTASSSSESGAARGSESCSSRPGTANHVASPVSHRLTGAPVALDCDLSKGSHRIGQRLLSVFADRPPPVPRSTLWGLVEGQENTTTPCRRSSP